MAYRFMQANRGRYTIKEMAGLFGVSRSAYYKWVRKGVSRRREAADAELVGLIEKIVVKHHWRYGSPRVRQELLDKYGKRVSQKKVACLMRENGLNARGRRKYIRTTDSKHDLYVYENILDRDFHAEKGGQKWVSDITYLRARDGWVYLTVVLDLFDRKVLGWAMSAGLHARETAVAALEMAVRNQIPLDGLIFHSDRGYNSTPMIFGKFWSGYARPFARA